MHNTLFPKFTLYRLRLLLELGARRQTLPAYLGSTVRGTFAAPFRQVVCVTRAPMCDGCLLLHRCPYPYIFEVPLVYRGEETLEPGLVLAGRALDFLPYFLYVVQEAGKSGLGRARVWAPGPSARGQRQGSHR